MRGFSPWADPHAARTSASLRAYDAIRQMILNGQLPAGSLIGEVQLANRLEISRTPLREALHALLRAGLVTEAPRRQLSVATIEGDRLDEVLKLRETIERFAVREAATTIGVDRLDLLRLNLIQQRRAVRAGDTARFLELDDEFHIRIASESKLPLTTEFLAQLRGYVRLALAADTQAVEWDAMAAVEEHEAIIEALEHRDPDAAEASLASQLARTRDVLQSGAAAN